MLNYNSCLLVARSLNFNKCLMDSFELLILYLIDKYLDFRKYDKFLSFDFYI